MDDLKINNIQKKFINTKEKFNYLFGLLIDTNLKKYTETHELSNLFEIDSTLDMLNISLGSIITNIEMFDNMGLLSNNVIDYSVDNNNNSFNYDNNNILDQDDLDTINNYNNENKDEDELERLVELHNLKESISNKDNNTDSNVDDNENDNEQENIINHMSNFVQSINKEKKKCIPKVLLPMILYSYMKMDPESILNKDIPKFDDNMFQNGQYNFDILNSEHSENNENNENYDEYSTDDSVIGSGVEDLD